MSSRNNIRRHHILGAVITLAAALLFALPVGLILGARSLEQVQRDRDTPVLALGSEAPLSASDDTDALPLLQPLPPRRAPEAQ